MAATDTKVAPEATTLTIKLFESPSEPAPHPTAAVGLDPGYKLLGGGARVDRGGAGNLLTALYPTSAFGWAGAAKDCDISDPQKITVYAYGFYDPDDLYDVQVFSAVSPGDPQSHPQATVTVPAPYQLVGGGAQAHWGSFGQYLTASCPTSDGTGWTAASKDHINSDPGTVTAYAVGLRARSGSPAVTIGSLTDSSVSPVSEPAEDQAPPQNTTLIGGGAQVVSTGGAGNMLTASCPDPKDTTQWYAASKDHEIADPAILTVWAIGQS